MNDITTNAIADINTQNAVISFIEGIKGIHYRPHRKSPEDFIVVKLYHRFDRQILETYLSMIGVSGDATLIKGRYKWIAIIDRDAWEEAVGVDEVSGQVEVEVEVEVDADLSVDEQEWSLEDDFSNVTVKTGTKKFTLDTEEVEEAQYQPVYSL